VCRLDAGADIILIDDPLKLEEALSGVQRPAANDWYDLALYSGLKDKAWRHYHHHAAAPRRTALTCCLSSMSPKSGPRYDRRRGAVWYRQIECAALENSGGCSCRLLARLKTVYRETNRRYYAPPVGFQDENGLPGLGQSIFTVRGEPSHALPTARSAALWAARSRCLSPVIALGEGGLIAHDTERTRNSDTLV
jgi:hypothetical protein